MKEQHSEMNKRYLAAKRALFDRAFGAHLNPEQCRAVFTVKGPLLVLAGAGSGKTTVLVNRISYVIKYGNAYFSDYVPEGLSEDDLAAIEEAKKLTPEEIEEILPQFITEPCPPWSVLAITFTNKAANEIKERLVRSFQDEEMAKAIWAGTFHSICMRILRKFGDKVGLREGFSIYDTDDKKRLVSMCMKELEIDEKRLSSKVVCNQISAAKDKLQLPDDIEDSRDPRARDIIQIYKLYQKRLSEYNAVDFDDIIMKTVHLLEEDRAVREYYQNKFKYVLVDEYQDTNYAQFVLTKILADGHRNIMVVGDDDQSIYKFRGATIENILNFDKTYEDATVVKLEQNYRSTANILEAANAVIRHNDDRHDKKLWCDRGDGSKIVLREVEDQNAEGRYIIDRITRCAQAEGRKYSDFAVLYRINALGRSLQTTFAKSGVPYRVLGDMGFYDRKEIKDIFAYLSVFYSADDNLRLKRIINEPKRKIGDKAVETIEEIASLMGTSMYNVIKNADEYTALAKNAPKLREFAEIFEGMRDVTLPSEAIEKLAVRSGYMDMLRAEGFEGETKIENVQEFISAAVEYEKRCEESEVEPTMSGFLEEISLISDVDKYDANADAVVLMTVHSAKGLEFPVVFLAGMEDGIFPSTQNIGEPSEMSEERRLAYVAITRAKDQLYITHAKNRLMYGKSAYNPLSRFVKMEIPPHLLEFDRPRPAPPRAQYGQYGQRPMSQSRQPERSYFREFNRPVEIGSTPKPKPQAGKSGAAQYGITKMDAGTRVRHSIFGAGTILSSRDMGGDVLYEVKFDSGEVKKLMATFARLEKI